MINRTKHSLGNVPAPRARTNGCLTKRCHVSDEERTMAEMKGHGFDVSGLKMTLFNRIIIHYTRHCEYTQRQTAEHYRVLMIERAVTSTQWAGSCHSEMSVFCSSTRGLEDYRRLSVTQGAIPVIRIHTNLICCKPTRTSALYPRCSLYRGYSWSTHGDGRTGYTR